MKKWCFLLLLFIANNIVSQTEEERAIELYEQKSLEESREIFEEILAEDPGNERAREYLGSIAFDFKEYRKSASYVKPLMEKYPNENPTEIKKAVELFYDIDLDVDRY